MTTLILVRHGESQANRKHIFAGHLNVDLEENGVLQAQRTAEYISDNYKVDKVYASDLIRAYKTGEIIADKLGTEIIADSRLREIFAGEWDGLAFEELERKYADEYEIWKTDIGKAKCQGGETVEQLSKRILGATAEIAESNDGKTLVIATHATPIRVLACKAKINDISRMKEIKWVTNASVSVFTFDKGKWDIIELSHDEHLSNLRTALPKNV